MPLGTEVGLGPGPGDIVLDGDPAPQKWGHSTPNFGPCLLWPNGWMDPGETRHEGLPRPTPHSVRWGPSSSKRGTASPIFSPCLLWPNGWMDQDVSWYGCRPWPRPQCVRLGPSPPPLTKGHSSPRLFGPCLTWSNGRPSQLLLSTCCIAHCRVPILYIVC